MIRTMYRNKRNPHKILDVHNDEYYHNAVKQLMVFENGVTNKTGDGSLHRWRKANLTELLEDYEEMPSINYSDNNFSITVHVAPEHKEEAEGLLTTAMWCWYGDEETMAETFPELNADAFDECAVSDPIEEVFDMAHVHIYGLEIWIDE